MNPPHYEVRLNDVTKVPSDLLLVKHAQSFSGVDRTVATALITSHLCREEDLRVASGESVIIDTHGIMAPARVMFLGTPSLAGFGYDQMEEFARRAIQIVLAKELPLRVLTTTVHGSGYGLDGGEALQRLIRGFEEGLVAAHAPNIERIVFLTLGERALRTLTTVLDGMAQTPSPPHGTVKRLRAPANEMFPGEAAGQVISSRAAQPGLRPEIEPRKKHVFVAMPYSEEFQNVFEFGIYPAVRNAGFICEKVDEVHFTGDILARIRQGIETASIVVADLTDGRPNVYLEVGYAWGHGTRVIFLARKGETLHFDVSTHRCIYYGKFSQLAKELEELLRGLEKAGEI